MSTRTITAAAVLGLAALGLGGCFGPGGPLLNYTGAPQTYVSSTYAPKTVTVIDVRSNEPIFEIDVPVGQQLSIQFLAGKGDDPNETPDLMRYELQERGKSTGLIANSLTVPDHRSLRVDVTLRQGPEYGGNSSQASTGYDRGDWWTEDSTASANAGGNRAFGG